MSMASQEQGSSRGPTWPDQKLVDFFPSGPRWKNVIKVPCLLLYASNHYIHVYMYACWEVCQLLAEGRWFPPVTPVTPVSSANKTDRHDIPKMLKWALNTN